MNIVFKTTKLEKMFNKERGLVKAYGAERAAIIMKRMVFLKAAGNLYRVPVTPPYLRHQLTGNYKGCFAVNVKHPYRLIFRPINDPLPVLGDGGLDLTRVTDIEIIGVEDYH
jgi:proteic killer suppression protein